LSLSRLKGRLDRCGSFKPTDEVRWAWDCTRDVAIALKARVVVFQTPARFQPSPVNKENFKNFFREADRGDFLLVWEPRGAWGAEEIQELCRELNLTHGVDPFKTDPSFGEVRYFRLHGVTGYRYRFREEDFKFLREKCRGKSYCLFNNVSMWRDALAFQEWVGEGAEVARDSRMEGE
jgi:uncharacterized protein YecE (DUF72 family)